MLTSPPIVSLVAVTMEAEELATHQQEHASAPGVGHAMTGRDQIGYATGGARRHAQEE